MPNEEEKNLIFFFLQSILQIHLKSANASNPRKGLQMIWQRLVDRFRSPKLIETFSKTKLFPPITNKELISMYDLLDEIIIQSARNMDKHSCEIHQ